MKPLPVKPLTPTLQEDLLLGEPSTTSGVTSWHWTNGIPPLKQPPFVECTYVPTFVSSDLNYCRHVHVHVQSKFYLVWMLLVVNIVICPIGTDCGGSAPVVGLYRQQRAFCPYCYWELLYASSKTCKCHFECHINCMHSHSYNVAR